MTATDTKRRFLLHAIAAPLCLGALGTWPRPGAAAEAKLSVVPVDEHITLISGAGGNVVVYRSSNAVVLIDSGAAEYIASTLAVVDEIRQQAPLQLLINTHWHDDHTGGNEVLRARGVNIVAHENTRLWLSADFDVPWRNRTYHPRPTAALPDRTFYNSDTLALGEETVELAHFAQAHTDGDLAVFFRRSNVLVAGGLLSNYRYPVADIATGGWIGGLLNANKALLEKVDNNTVIIPDSGAPLSKADLHAQHDMLADIYDRMKKLAQEGYSGRDMLNEKITAGYDERWGDPEEFLLESYRGMWAHTYDMGGFI